MSMLLTRPTGFVGFGPSILARQTRGRLRGSKIPTQRLDARQMVREKCPRVPGVYGWLDEHRQLVYVGKSKSLRHRLLSYFGKTPADKKMLRIRQHSEHLVWEPISNELLALIREQELIHRWRPDFNSQGQPTRTQPAFLCISGGPVPNARLSRKYLASARHSYGPISGTGNLSQAIVSLNQVFQLRDCPDKTGFEFSNQQLLFDDPSTAKCIRYELGTCPGPCAGCCSATTYQANVDRAVRFLEGRDSQTLPDLESRMKRAAADQAFEKATILRDCWENLTWLDRRLASLREAQNTLNGVVMLEARKQRTAWIVLRGGRIIGSTVAPDRPERATAVEKQLENAGRQPVRMSANLLEMRLQLIVISWFRKNPILKNQLLPFPEAIRQCREFRGNCQRRSA